MKTFCDKDVLTEDIEDVAFTSSMHSRETKGVSRGNFVKCYFGTLKRSHCNRMKYLFFFCMTMSYGRLLMKTHFFGKGTRPIPTYTSVANVPVGD